MRGFGPAPFALNGGRGEPNAAVKKAAGPGEPVTQEIALSVKGDKVECAINGTVVGSYDKAAVVTAGKLKSTDGIVRHPLRAQHRSHRHRPDDDEELVGQCLRSRAGYLSRITNP